ncbi:hypothetical protein [Rhodanobacter lindaniclasticus]
MNVPRILPALLATLLAAPAWAQSTAQPLNLKLPPGELPAASSTTAAPARDAADAAAPTIASPTTGAATAGSTATNPQRDAPGVYYGDTSGSMGRTEVVRDTRPDCDDSTYNQPQVHGSVGMGVAGGSRFSGNYQTGTVNITRAFGSCDDPGGGISISVGAGSGHFHGRGH